MTNTLTKAVLGLGSIGIGYLLYRHYTTEAETVEPRDVLFAGDGVHLSQYQQERLAREYSNE